MIYTLFTALITMSTADQIRLHTLYDAQSCSKSLVKLIHSKFENTDGIYTYIYDNIEKSCVIRPTHIIFEKLDNFPLNFTFELYDMDTLITSISNDIIETSNVTVNTINASTNNWPK